MKFIIGKKIEMTQIWRDDKVTAVTRVQAGPCAVTQVKTMEKDRYEAVQLGFGNRKEKNISKPQLKHMDKAGVRSEKLREFRIETEMSGKIKVGDRIDVSTFEAGDIVNVAGITKGRGFQGVVKRHRFHGQNKTHGTKDQLRMPGSIGATGPAHVFKGMRMPGRMGGDRVTITNLEIIEVDSEKNELLIKGGIPGARNGFILVSGLGELKIAEAVEKVEVINTDEQKHENTENTEAQKHENTKTEDILKDSNNSEVEKGVERKDEVKKDGAPEEVEKEVVEAKEKIDDKDVDKK